MEKKLTAIVSLTALCLWLGAGLAHADLVAHWKLDEPAGTEGPDSIIDSGPSAMYHGTPAFAAGSPVIFEQPGATDTTESSVEFDGGVIDVPYDPALNPASFTFCVWVRATDAENLSQFQSVVTSRHDALPDLKGYILYYDVDHNWNFWTGRSGGWDGLVGGPVVIDEWTHLAISFDADTGIKTIYVDGFPTSTNVQLYVPNDAMDLHLGAGGDTGTQYYFTGGLDDAGLWSLALEEADVLQVMDEGVAAVPDNLVAHWALDEPEDTGGPDSVVDSASGGFHGTPRLPFAAGQPGANDNTGTSIVFGNASIDVLYDPALNPESFTAMAWVKPTATAGYQSVFTSRYDIGPGTELQGYILYNDADGVWAFWTGDGDPGWPAVLGTPVAVDVWQHVAISVSVSPDDPPITTKTLFVDGAQVGSADTQGYVPNTLQNLHIGGGGDLGLDFRFTGAIDDVGIWDEALDAETILDMMLNGIHEIVDGEATFLRGDANDDGQRNIADAISLLGFLFGGGAAPVCPDAGDANDDGNIDIADAIAILGHLFGGAGDLPPPFVGCGVDPTDDPLAECATAHCP